MPDGTGRTVSADALEIHPDYRVEPLIRGLTLPSAIAFGPGGELYVSEAGAVGPNRVGVPRVLRFDTDGTGVEIGRLDYTISGLAYMNDQLLIAENGPSPHILAVAADGEVRAITSGLPGGGDYGLSNLTHDHRGNLFFGLGTRTNSGVVGQDNVASGWARDYPERCDIPGFDVELNGVNYLTPSHAGTGAFHCATGGFLPLGTRSEPGQRIAGNLTCGGAVYRYGAEGEVERLGHGLRNPVGVAVGPDGRVFATEGGMEERGSRPVANASDCLWEVRGGQFYGWPDYVAGKPVTEPEFRLPGHMPVQPLLKNAPTPPAQPLAQFGVRAGVGRLSLSSADAFGYYGDAFVALSGAWSLPAFAGPAASGRAAVVRVEPRSRRIMDFLKNRNGSDAGLLRPVEIAFDPSGEVLYVVDLGAVFLDAERGPIALGGTGVVWRITRVAPVRVSAPAPVAGEPEEDDDDSETLASDADGSADDADADETEGGEVDEATDDDLGAVWVNEPDTDPAETAVTTEGEQE